MRNVIELLSITCHSQSMVFEEKENKRKEEEKEFEGRRKLTHLFHGLLIIFPQG